MKRVAEWVYWTVVALTAVGWVAVLIDKFPPRSLDHLGPADGVVTALQFLTFPGFTQLFVPGWLFGFILESRETAARVYHAETAIYAVLAAAAALWFGLSHGAPLRRRVLVMAVLIAANTLGLAASLPRLGYLMMFGIFSNGYYEWKAAKDAAEVGKGAQNALSPQPVRPATPAER